MVFVLLFLALLFLAKHENYKSNKNRPDCNIQFQGQLLRYQQENWLAFAQLSFLVIAVSFVVTYE